MKAVHMMLYLALIMSSCATQNAHDQIQLIEQEARYNRVLDKAEALFAKGKFEQSNESLVELLISDQTIPVAYRARLYLLKARLATAFAQDSEVKVWLGKLYHISPETQLDPLRDPPKTMAVWQQLKSGAGASSTKPSH